MENVPKPEDKKNQLELFEIRRYLGRTVFIIGNIIQADFTPDDDPEDLVA